MVFENVRDLGKGKNMSHSACGNGAFWHAVKSGLTGFLRDHQSALRLDGNRTSAAIRAGSRENKADSPVAKFHRQGLQEEIKRQAGTTLFKWLGDSQCTLTVGERATRWNHIDMIGFNQHAVTCLLHGHCRVTGQEFNQHAVMIGFEMLYEYEGHADWHGQRVKKISASFQAAC